MLIWNDKFSVNVKAIDEQHKKLIAIMDRIQVLASLDDKYDHYDELMEILLELKDYTRYHFDFEEKLLSQYNYALLENQHFEHVFFTKKLDRITRKDIDNEQTGTINEIYNFVAEWISGHIFKSDMQYKEFLNKNEVY